MPPMVTFRPRKHRTGAKQLDSLGARLVIFSALAKGLDAGLTPGACLSSALSEKDPRPVHAAIKSLDNGKTVAAAFKAHRLGSNFDLSLIGIGETSGRLAAVSQLIADRYKRIIDRKQRLRSKLSMPLFVGLFAIVVMPIPDILAGNLDPWRYLFCILFIGLISLAAWWLIRLLFIKHSTNTTGYPAHAFISVPIIGKVLEDYSTANFIERLHLLFASGFPIIDAVKVGHESLIGFGRRRRYKQLERDLHLGDSVADTFEHHAVLSSFDLAILATGEAAGRLEESLARISRDTRTRFDSKIDFMVAWFPRVVYLLITFSVVSKIL